MEKRIADLERANRMFTMLSRINRCIIRAESPDGLYDEVCNIAVDCGLFKFACVGLVEPHSNRLRIISSHGAFMGPRGDLMISGGVADTVRRSGELSVFNDLSAMPQEMACRWLGEQGFHAIACLPMRENSRVTGVFMLCTDMKGCFDHQVVNLLQEVTDDIAFCLDQMLNEQRRLVAEAKIRYLAFYDAQTGMPNRALLEERLPVLAAGAEKRGKLLALLDIRLKRLDKVVQMLGSLSMDELLRTLALRLESYRGTDGLLAQMGPDEFLLVSPELNSEAEFDVFAAEVRRALQESVRIGGKEVYVQVALGGVMYPLHERDVSNLLRRARAAAERSSADMRFCIYHADFDRGLEQRMELEAELHRALERNEFLLYYQPQLNLKTGVIVGVEALLRWQHPQRGLIPPVQFIPLLEECGLMSAVGAWVLREACRQAREWQDNGLEPIRIAVNLSAQQFRHAGLVETVRKSLHDFALDAECLELELTESLILENAEQTIQIMHQLKKLGLSLSLDDFGTGYSSLSYLGQYPVDRIKIDQSFIREVAARAASATLVRSILAMAFNLGLGTTAEGVETEDQLGYLRKNFCQEMQGYLFSRPIPPGDIALMLADGRKISSLDTAGEAATTLLLVDDEPFVLSALKRVFRRENFQVLTAESTRMALELLATREVGVIISDQRMPDISGTEFLHRVKTMYPDTIRILLTGYTDFRAVIDAVNQGDLYKVLSKPIEDELLRENVREAFRRYEIVAENRRLTKRLEALERMQAEMPGK